MTPASVLGIHHITAICGNPQVNVDFYAGILGLRLVKRTVNQDDPYTYHLFYADAVGTPGTDLTFFPWEHLPPGRIGSGMVVRIAFAVSPMSLPYWQERLERYNVPVQPLASPFGEEGLCFSDPDGLALSLVAVEHRQAVPWPESPVPPDHQVRGLHSASIVVSHLAPTANFLQRALGFALQRRQGTWHRFAVMEGRSGQILEVQEDPSVPPGEMGLGTVHHIAWRVADEAHQLEMRQRVMAAGQRATPVIDRFWFRSVYFWTPGGVLFELATDGPGFAVDEDPAHLGERLVLPPWLEARRAEIEARLPALTYPPR